jgi:hypothetical protein
MPLPLNPPTRVQQNQVPQFKPSVGGVDISGLAQGVFNLTSAVAINERANALNRGRAAALQLQQTIQPEIQLFIQQRAGESTFPLEFTDKFQRLIDDNSQLIELGPTSIEQETFNREMQQYAVNTLKAGLDFHFKKFLSDQTAIFHRNVEHLSQEYEVANDERPIPTMPSDQERVLFKLVESFQAVASDRPEAPGIMSPKAAKSILEEQVRKLAIASLTKQMAKNPATAMEFLEKRRVTINVPTITEDLILVKDEDGLPTYKKVEITQSEYESILSAVQNRVHREKEIREGVRRIYQEKDYIFIVLAKNEAMQRILNGEVNVADEMISLKTPSGLPAFSDDDIRQLKSYELQLAKEPAERPTTDFKAFTKFLEQASFGKLDIASLLAHNGISLQDKKSILKSQFDEVNRQFDKAHTEFEARKRFARSVLSQQFGVHALFVAKGDVANFLPGVLIAFEERLTKKEREIVAAGGDLSSLDPLAVAQEIIQERQNAFYSVLAPQAANLGKQLAVYYELAKKAQEPTLAGVYKALEHDRKSKRIGQAEYLNQLFILKSLAEQGVTFNKLGEMIAGGVGIFGDLDLSTDPETGKGKSIGERLKEAPELFKWIWDAIRPGSSTLTERDEE